MHIGDLKNEDSVLEWLSDDDNRELADEIEAVNSRMLERLLDESPFLAVYFCKYPFCSALCGDAFTFLASLKKRKCFSTVDALIHSPGTR